MQNYRKNFVFSRVFQLLLTFLPSVFCCLIIFGFEEPNSALATLICATIHECGHIAYILLSGGSLRKVRGILHGRKIKPSVMTSYKAKLLTYLSGPMANILAFILCSALSVFVGEIFSLPAILNLATGISNLLPIYGYDGYGIIHTIIEKNGYQRGKIILLNAVSSGITFFLCIISLYLIDRLDGGYWIYFVFLVSAIKQFSKTLPK